MMKGSGRLQPPEGPNLQFNKVLELQENQGGAQPLWPNGFSQRTKEPKKSGFKYAQ